MKFVVNPDFLLFLGFKRVTNSETTFDDSQPSSTFNCPPILLFTALHHLPVSCWGSRQSCLSGCSEVAHDRDAELVLCDKDGWTGDVDLVALLLEMLPNHSLIFAPLRFLRLDGGVSVMRCSFSRGVGVCTECFRIVVSTLLMRSCSLSSEVSGRGFLAERRSDSGGSSTVVGGSGSRMDTSSSEGTKMSGSSFVGDEGSVREEVGTRQTAGG